MRLKETECPKCGSTNIHAAGDSDPVFSKVEDDPGDFIGHENYSREWCDDCDYSKSWTTYNPA